MLLTCSQEKIFESIGINKNWFSRTTKCVPMVSCLYFTATRNITASDIVHVFENVLNIGIIYQEYVNIVPVLNKNYNHVFLKIQWNDTIETANFVNEIVVNSSIKVYHNKGYWVCRMSKNPLKLRHSKMCVKIASFYCTNSDSESESESESQEQNVSMQVKELEATQKVSTNEGEDKKVSTNEGEEEEDFYVIKEEVKEEVKEELNSVVE
jgi:hypothetical protein